MIVIDVSREGENINIFFCCCILFLLFTKYYSHIDSFILNTLFFSFKIIAIIIILIVENVSPSDLAICSNPIIKSRELFASECRDIYPASYIKYAYL
jgi:hypothetical protein